MLTSHEVADIAVTGDEVGGLDPEQQQSNDDAPEIELDLTLDSEDAYCASW